MSNIDVGLWHPALLQKAQWALHPLVTFTKRLTDGGI